MPVDELEPDFDATDLDHCPNWDGKWLVSESSGEMFRSGCRRNKCGYCVQQNARRRSLAISLAEPQRAVLLTGLGPDWQTRRARIKRLKWEIEDATGKDLEWVYSVEPNPAGTGFHGHFWQRGDFIPQKILSAKAERVGMAPFARINKVRSQVGAGKYGLKGVGYGLKGVLRDEAAAEYLTANGARLTHQSRGFFLDAEGKPAPVRTAERDAGRINAKDSGPWLVLNP